MRSGLLTSPTVPSLRVNQDRSSRAGLTPCAGTTGRPSRTPTPSRLTGFIARKISAEEVENLIYQLPGIDQVAAVAMPDDEVGERVCVYVVPSSGETVTLER